VFPAAPLASVILTLQIVPYFMTDSKACRNGRRSAPKFASRGFFRAIVMALFVGADSTYWQSARSHLRRRGRDCSDKVCDGVAFERALGTQWPVRVILAMAFLGLFQCFNGNFVASSRLLSLTGDAEPFRGRSADSSCYQTPHVAVIGLRL